MSAPKGNRFAIGNHGGRPQHYETVQQLWEKAGEYFSMVTSSTGISKPTKAGLMYHLGFATRQSYYDYKKRGDDTNGDNWEHAICLIDRFIEACYESQLYGFAWAGSAFALKNRYKEDWKDEITEHSDKKVTHVVIEEKKRDA